MSALAGPAPLSSNPLRRLAGDLVAERAASVPFPPGDDRPSLPAPSASPPTRCAPARRLRALRARLHACGSFHGQQSSCSGRRPTTTSLSPTRPTSAGATAAWRPDAAAGRRAADHRRRLPPPLAPDHAARVPPRADRRVTRHDARRRPTRALEAGGPARRSTSTAGRASSRCASRCARCSASTPTRGASGARPPPASSSARWSF